MQVRPGHSRFFAAAIACLWLAGGCRPAASVTGGAGGNASGGSGGNASGGSGGNASGGSGGNAWGGAGGRGSGGSASGGSGASNAGGTDSGGSGARGGSGGSTGGAGGRGSGAGGSSAGGSSAGGSSAGGSSAGGSSAGGSGAGGSSAGGSGGSASAGGSGTGGTRMGGAGGGLGGAGGVGQSGTDAPTAITGLKIEANAKNVLSAFVSWTTDRAADSAVQFGEGKYEWEISDAALVTSHKLLIIGMHASKAYQIKAISSNGGSSVSATGSYTTGSLPAQLPAGSVTSNDTTKSQSGWTLMNVQKGDGNSVPSSTYPAMAVMYDAGGQPVWYYTNGTTSDYGGAISVDLTDQGVLIGPVMDSTMTTKEPPREVDFAGNTLWQCSDANCGTTDGYLSHHASKLANGDYVVLRWITTNNNQNPIYEEITPDNKKVWSLDFSKFVPAPSGVTGDWCHGNSITVDIAKNVVYANCRFMGLIKTTYTNPALEWYLPASYGKATGSLTFSPATSQYSDTHDPEIHDDGTILFFDNGGYDPMSFFPGGTTTTFHSRAVEYKIDETAKTATLVWEFPGTFTVDSWYKNNWYQPFWGDADRLANGNVLVTAGNRGSGTESRVFEVTKADGKVVWEFHLGPDMGIYRAERITPPLVHAVSP